MHREERHGGLRDAWMEQSSVGSGDGLSRAFGAPLRSAPPSATLQAFLLFPRSYRSSLYPLYVSKTLNSEASFLMCWGPKGPHVTDLKVLSQ